MDFTEVTFFFGAPAAGMLPHTILTRRCPEVDFFIDHQAAIGPLVIQSRDVPGSLFSEAQVRGIGGGEGASRVLLFLCQAASS